MGVLFERLIKEIKMRRFCCGVCGCPDHGNAGDWWKFAILCVLLVILASIGGCSTQGQVMRMDLQDIRTHEMQQRLNTSKLPACV